MFRYKQLAVVLVSGLLGMVPAGFGNSCRVYIGTFTGVQSHGIYTSLLDIKTGKLTQPVLAAATPDPSFLAVSPDARHLYSVNELPDGNQGSVSTFAINPENGLLSLLDRKTSGGVGPCHLSVTHNGKSILVANYASGTIEILPLQTNGIPENPSARYVYQGHGPNLQRQQAPHAHFLAADPSDTFALGCDLGTDQVRVFRLGPDDLNLDPDQPSHGNTPPGSGPRHLVFSRDQQRVYVINEMGCSVTRFAWNSRLGSLSPFGTLSLLPTSSMANSASTAAEILLDESGRHLYTSVRGANRIEVINLGSTVGNQWDLAQDINSGGLTPRGLGLDPSGHWILAANQGSGNVAEFAVDPVHGTLSPTGVSILVGSPVDVLFVPLQ